MAMDASTLKPAAKPPPVKGRSRTRRWLLLAGACLQNASNTGLLFGYAALAPAFQALQQGDAQPVDTGQIFTWSVSANMLAPLLLAGPVLDVLGPRMCACVCTVLVGAGFLLFGVSPALPGRDMDYLLPAMLLIGVGGPGCQSSLFHTANLFPSRGFALNLITASIGPSFMMFEVLVKLHEWFNLSLQQAFLLYSCLPFACTLLGAFTMSDMPFHSSECPDKTEQSPPSSPSSPRFDRNLAAFHTHMGATCTPHVGHCLTHSTRHARKISLGAARPMVFIRKKKEARQLRSASHWSHHGADAPLLGSPGGSSNNDGSLVRTVTYDEDIGVSLREQLLSGAFAELTLVFVVNSLFYNLFLGNMQHETQAALLVGCGSGGSEQEVAGQAAKFVATYLRLSPLSVFLNPCLGYCIDRFGFSPLVALMILSGVTHALSLRLGFFAPAVVAFSIFSNSNFAYMFSYLAFEFGFDYYGLLAGVIQAVAGIATLVLQPCLIQIAGHRGWQFVQSVQIASLLLLGFVLGIRILREWRKSRSRAGSIVSPLRAPDDPSGRARVEGSPGSLVSARSYSEGDLHSTPADQACRRRCDLFPHVDDILVIDGALPHHSRAAYLLDTDVHEELRPPH